MSKPELKTWTIWHNGEALYCCNEDFFDTIEEHLLFICEMNNWLQVNDSKKLTEIVEAIIGMESNAKIIADIKSGNQKAIGSLLGQAKKLSGGSLDMNLIKNELLEKLK